MRLFQRTDMLIATCAIDNLVKGAAGQAVQCANVMYGLSEVAGFTAAVLPGTLVAWCLGFAAAATAVRVTWLGARVAGILAGAVGVAAGAALFLLNR